VDGLPLHIDVAEVVDSELRWSDLVWVSRENFFRARSIRRNVGGFRSGIGVLARNRLDALAQVDGTPVYIDVIAPEHADAIVDAQATVSASTTSRPR
jgi:hypothetical protein